MYDGQMSTRQPARRRAAAQAAPPQDRAARARAAHAHVHDHSERARELLRERGLRVTAPRLALLKVLLDNHRPTSAQELIDAVAGAGDIDDVTVYRTVNVLVEHGIAQTVGTSERGRKFEVHACEGCRVDHPHLECRGCGALRCLEEGVLPSMVVPTELAGFQVEEARLYLYGRCASCQKRPARQRTR